MKNLKTPPSWDLSDLFSSIDDPEIERVLDESSKRAKKFHKKYRGNLSQFAEPAKLLEIIKEYESILSDAVKPQAYGELVFTVDSINPQNGAFLQKVKTKVTELFSELIFFELELGYFSEKTFKRLLESEELLSYRHYLERLLAWKKHRLTEAEEKIMELKELTGRQAMIRLFEQELSKQKFEIDIEGKVVQMTQSEVLNQLYSSDKQETRSIAAKAFTKGLLQKESVLVFVANSLVEDKKIEDNLRGFASAEQSRHLSNEAKPQAVEAMCGVVEQFYGLVQDYYVFKKQVLGLEKIYDCDRYAPLKLAEKQYTFQEAQELVLSSFRDFHPEFEAIARDFFDKKWIDAATAHGKRGGAYCECATPDMHPYVFMNFTGSANDVMTLAHELGHAINFQLARKQTFLNYNCPLTLAETASIFAETLTFSKLVSSVDDKDVLLGLYMQKIESIFASVQRQISMYRFEQDVHDEYRKNGELSKEKINLLWRGRQKQMFDDSIILTEDYDNWWMYISHFIATPFYVYAYAFGELLALGLFDASRKNPNEFFEKYKKFLEEGGSHSPNEMAALFGIDLEDQEFWKSGMQMVKQYIDKAKALYLER